jgi:hypothetical protein
VAPRRIANDDDDDDDDVQARESIREAGNGDSHQRADLESETARDRKLIARQSRGQSSEKPPTIPENWNSTVRPGCHFARGEKHANREG